LGDQSAGIFQEISQISCLLVQHIVNQGYVSSGVCWRKLFGLVTGGVLGYYAVGVVFLFDAGVEVRNAFVF